MSTTVLLVDDHELIRQGLARAFERDEDMHIVGQAGSVSEGLRVAREVTPDVCDRAGRPFPCPPGSRQLRAASCPARTRV